MSTQKQTTTKTTRARHFILQNISMLKTTFAGNWLEELEHTQKKRATPHSAKW